MCMVSAWKTSFCSLFLFRRGICTESQFTLFDKEREEERDI